jgi:hypothetical protein
VERKLQANLAKVVKCALLTVSFVMQKLPLAILSFAFFVAYVYRSFFREGVKLIGIPIQPSVDVEYGKLGRNNVDADPDDTGYGLYITLNGTAVFVDLREDGLLEKREARARYLYENSRLLEESLLKFIAEHKEYVNSRVEAIGIHLDNLDRAEVFWSPNGYTLLKGLEFV